ncbi:MAG TPA: flagellar biosynthesis protein FlhF [Planctomycetaceae bacterium]|nr:flagellar biosynthesis protein FlhF [Planctomycetaceae bacterium]
MTEVKTFKAASMQEALEIVRRELGSEAVILHTRQVSRRKLFPWSKAKPEVEVTAGVGVNVRPRSMGIGPGRSDEHFKSASEEAVRTPRPPKTRGAAKTAENGSPTCFSADPASLASSASNPREHAAAIWSELCQRSPGIDLTAPPEFVDHDHAAAAAGPAISAEPANSAMVTPEELAARLDSIQAMVERLSRTAQMQRKEEIPPELFHLYTHLIDADVEDDLARELIFRVRRSASADQLSDGDAAMSLLTAMIESEIRCSGPITPRAGSRQVVALVGPTGVGKTTTIAKLAANFRLRDGIKMGLVTVDTYRIAAVEQLRTYAEIIDLPMKVVTSPLEMRRALEELNGLDLVLIDTAGRSPRDDLKIQELKSLLAEADVDEVHLVLSMTASARSLIATAERFAPANITALVLTKLDEAAEMGTLLSVARKIPLPISYLTTGQDVPDDIEPARAGRIARLILGQEPVVQ